MALSSGNLQAGVLLTIDATTAASQAGAVAIPSGYADLPNYINSTSHAGSATGNAGAYSFANSSGAYAVSSNSEGATATANANAELRYKIKNDSGVAQSYSAQFKIYGGSISTNLFGGATLVGAEFLRTSYEASIKVGGSSVFSSTASILMNASGTSFTRTGTSLNDGDNGDDGYYGWGAQYVTVDLGILGIGDETELVASLVQSSASDAGLYDFGGNNDGYCGYGGYGVPSLTAFSEVPCSGFKGSSDGFYGDPAELDTGTQLILTSRDVSNNIPEPGSLALMLAALGAGALVQRKRSVSV